MPRKPSSRKFQLTINNPQDHGFDHVRIQSILSEFPGCVYWGMCDEIGEQGTPHTHIYVVFRNSVMFDTLHKKFYGAHIEPVQGSHKENRDYIRKDGKWAGDAKHETNLPDTFEEWGELPSDRTKGESQAEQIMDMSVAERAMRKYWKPSLPLCQQGSMLHQGIYHYEYSSGTAIPQRATG